jgi:ATP-dependent Clp protease ATP-binding subunit ClpB
MSNFEFTDKAQETIASAVQLAKDYANAQGKLCFFYFVVQNNINYYLLVHPAHIASVMLNESPAEQAIPSSVPSPSSTSLFHSVISQAGGDPQLVKRGLQKVIVRLPAQSPPPDETSFSSGALKVLREAQELQKTMHDSYIVSPKSLFSFHRILTLF